MVVFDKMAFVGTFAQIVHIPEKLKQRLKLLVLNSASAFRIFVFWRDKDSLLKSIWYFGIMSYIYLCDAEMF